MPDSYKDLTHSAAEIDAAVGKADTAVQPADIGTAAAQDVDYFATAAQGAKADTAVQPGDLGTAATASASDFATAAQGENADSAIQGLKANGSTVPPDSDKIISITIPTSASDVNALPNTTKYAAAIDVSINSSTYVMTVQLKDQNGDNLGSSDSIDLPLETMVVGGSYDSTDKKVILTLKNGETVEFSVADLVSGLQTELSASNKLNPAYINYDSAHRAVSDTEKSTWNGKQSALTSAQLAAVNSGMTSEDVEQINTNKNNILYNTNMGVKNLSPYNSGTAPTSDGTIWNNLPIDLVAGIYTVSFSTNSTTVALVLLASDETTEVFRGTYSTTTVKDTFTISAEAKYIRLYIGASKTVSDFMIRSFGDDTFVPYAKSNSDLTTLSAEDRAALVELVDSAAKNFINVGFTSKSATATAPSISNNGDGSITLNGSNTGNNPIIVRDICSDLEESKDTRYTLPAGVYELCGTGNEDAVLQAYMHDGTSANLIQLASASISNVVEFSYTSSYKSAYPYICFRLYIKSPTTSHEVSFDNVIVRPMVCTKAAWDISHTYQPYRPSYQELYESVEITNISNDIIMKGSGTLESNTKVWKQGNHIFGQIVITTSIEAPFSVGQSVITLAPAFRPAYEQTRPCACIGSGGAQPLTGYYNIADSSNPFFPGEILVYPNGSNCTKISMPIDFVL